MKKTVLITLLSFLTFFTTSAQLIFEEVLQKLNKEYPQEKIHVHFDKTIYNPGETVWFKLYLFADNVPSTWSNTVFAELIDENGQVLQKKSMPVAQSTAASFFELPTSAPSAKLFVRAYTTWMLNFDHSYLYSTPLQITTPSKEAIVPIPSSTSLQLFPEGGYLVNGIVNKVAFKASNEQGRPVEIKGVLVTETGKEIVSVTSVHNGMGFFNFLPIEGENYFLQWSVGSAATKKTAIPIPQNSGVLLKVNNEANAIRYYLSRPTNGSNDYHDYYIVGQMNQQLLYTAKVNLSQKSNATATIPLDSLRDGILQLTLFNEQQQPLAERLVFIYKNQYHFQPSVELAEKNIQSKGKNVLNIALNNLQLSNLSVAVTDASLDEINELGENIYTKLLLTSDIKGYVHEPGYYFKQPTDSVKQQLDLVMMTNGWRRFNWEKLVKNEWPTLLHSRGNYLTIEGMVSGLSAKQLEKRSVTGMIISNGKTIVPFIELPLNEFGRFRQDGIYFFDTLRFNYKLSNDEQKKLTYKAEFRFENGTPRSVFLPDDFSDLYNAAISVDPMIVNSSKEQFKKYYDQAIEEKIKTLEDVTVKSTVKKTYAELLDEKLTSGVFSSYRSRLIAVANDPAANTVPNLSDYLRRYNNILTIQRPGISGTSYFLDQMPTSLADLNRISMADVVLIKVFEAPFLGIRDGSNGAIAVYTRAGGDVANLVVKGLNEVTLQGFSPIKEFYSPEYSNTNEVYKPDYRTTLYWNPFVLLNDKKSSIQIPFYNNDSAKKIRVVVEGINQLGQLTRVVKTFE